MTTATRVFIARLAGVAVYDPNGDQVGRVRDAVARPRPGQPPRIIGLTVEIGVRRRIFLPLGRVTSIEPESVLLSTGTINLKRFEKKPGESLVVEDLLDRRITVLDGPEGDRPGTVVDVAMEQERSGQWALARVAVRITHPSRLPRRGQLLQVDWERVSGLLDMPDEQGVDSLLTVLHTMRAADLANTLQELSGRRRLEVAAALDDDRLADVLEELPEEDQVEILSALDLERAADVLEAMDPDDAADVLAELPETEKEQLLERMEPDEAEPVRRLMDYESGSAGSIMTSEPVILSPDTTIAEALAAIREPKLSPVLGAQVFVCRAPLATPTGRFLGMVHFQRLLREPPSDLVGAFVVDDLDPVSPDTPIADVTRRMATYDLVAMPVVDDGDRLVGAVTVDDVLDNLLPPDWRNRDHA